MKRWHILLLTIILSAGILGVSGILVYKYYFVPRYMEPIVEEIGNYVKKEDVMDSLYQEAERLHQDGVIEDDIYSKFMRAYNKYKRDDLEYAKKVLDNYNSDDSAEEQKTSLSTKYASYKVGVESILVNGSDSGGKADVKYSGERTSDRIKVDDVIEAEKIIENAEKSDKKDAEFKEDTEDKSTPTPDVVKSAYDKLRTNMTADEFSSFTSIMKKLDIDTLKTYMSDKAGLKQYLRESLTDEEYSKIVNLGYKYVSIFIDDEH